MKTPKKKFMPVHYSSESTEWQTPRMFFQAIDLEFELNTDVCATLGNKMCKKFFSKKEDGLKQDWKGLRCWMNPPYGKEIGAWVEKAATGGADIVVALLPARTDTRWFHDHIYKKAEVRFLRGRLRFGGNANSAPFPNMIVIFRSGVRMP